MRTISELEIFLRLAAKGRLGAGERAAIAVALNRGCALAIDDSRAIRRALQEAALGENALSILRTQDIMVELIRGTVVSIEAPRYEDNETTTDQLKARLAKTVAYLKTLDRKQIDASADREITFPLGPTNKGHMKGDDYLELLFPCHSRLRDPASLRRGHRQARLFGCDPHEANLRQPGRRGLPPRSCAEGYRHPADALAAISP